MPEIGECYSIAQKIPEQGKVDSVYTSENFYKYINLDKSFKQLPQTLTLGQSFAYGKSIWFPITTTDQHGYLVMQLGMSGSFFLNETGRDPKNDHLVFTNKKQKLRYSDPRMFGKAKCFLINFNESLEDLKKQIIKSYKWGLDPYIEEENNLISALNKWKKSGKNIKSLMLEQNVIFGLGNYLCSEILFKSKISPYKVGQKLKDCEIKELVKNIKKTVALAVKTGGYSFAGGYYHPDGSKGSMAKYIKAYEKEGNLCSQCQKGIIKKEFINTRSTYYCPICQKK